MMHRVSRVSARPDRRVRLRQTARINFFEPAPQLHASDRADGQVVEVVAIYGIRDGLIVRVTFLR